MDAVVVAIRFGAGHGHAVIGRDDDQRVIELARRIKAGDYLAQVSVEVIYFVGIVEQHRSTGCGIRQETRYLYRGQFLFLAWSFGVGEMRLVGAIPEVEWLTVIAFVQELLKVGSIISIGYAFLGFGLQFQVVVLDAGRVLLPATRKPVPGPPALAREACFVARVFQQVDKGLVMDWK